MKTNLGTICEELRVCKAALTRIEAQLFRDGDMSSKIRNAVCNEFKISQADIMKRGRQEWFTWPRQVAMYLERELTNKTLTQIGDEFRKDWTTALHAWRHVKEIMETNLKIHIQIDAIKQRISDDKINCIE